MRKRLTFVSCLILFAGIAIAVFPYIRGALMDQNANRTAEEFLSGVITDPYRESEAVVPAAEPTEKPREHLDLWNAMVAYNDSLYAENQCEMVNGQSLEVPPFILAGLWLLRTRYSVSSQSRHRSQYAHISGSQ